MADQKKAVDAALVRELAVILNETDLTEIEVDQDGLHIRVAREVTVTTAPQQAMAYAPAPAPTAAPQPAATEAPKANNHDNAVKAPMVGTVYLSPPPALARSSKSAPM
nr:hypothetical protein [Marinicella sp. W31]MDC2877680.1 hypothetical protein [Marinicella sp. W31]